MFEDAKGVILLQKDTGKTEITRGKTGKCREFDFRVEWEPCSRPQNLNSVTTVTVVTVQTPIT